MISGTIKSQSFCLLFFTPVASVIFAQTEYSVRENELQLDVCVFLDGPGETAVPINVDLALQQDDQTPTDMRVACEISYQLLHCMRVLFVFSFSVGSDTDPLQEPQITFPPSVTPLEPICRTVSVVDDTVFENLEIFLVSMSTLRERVMVDSPAQVTITDDDGQ